MTEICDLGIVGAGITGLSLAWRLAQTPHALRIRLFEASSSPGGNAVSTTEDGFTLDWGPNGFLTNVPYTLQLVHDLGLSDTLIAASDAARHRYLVHQGRLQALPSSLFSFLGSPLLSWRAKFRLFREPWIPRYQGPDDESIHNFASRRFGPEIAEKFVAPMAIGIVGGDTKRLSLAGVFPRFQRMEEAHGSLLRAMLHQARLAKKAPLRPLLPAPPGPKGRLTSFQQGGIGFLTQTLATRLKDRLLLRTPIAQIARTSEGHFLLTTDQGTTFGCKALVLAIPAFAAAQLLRDLSPSLADRLQSIPYAPIRVISLAWPKKEIPHPLHAFGFLVPRSENVQMLGSLWTSSIFPHQAPPDMALFRLLYGGDFGPPPLDDDALSLAIREFSALLGISTPPAFFRQRLWPHAIPQYRPGYPALLDAISHDLTNLPGLWLAGNGLRGVALNDCTAEAERLAALLPTFLHTRQASS